MMQRKNFDLYLIDMRKDEAESVQNQSETRGKICTSTWHPGQTMQIDLHRALRGSIVFEDVSRIDLTTSRVVLRNRIFRSHEIT